MGADSESRRGADPSDWMLLPEVFQEIHHRLGPLDIDLFAARHNSQLPRFYSYRLDPLAEAVDALGQKWSTLHPYAIHPTGSSIAKKRDRVHQAVVIAPTWPNQHWYPLLLETMSDLPLIVPQTPHLLMNPAGEPNPLIQQVHQHLAAWRVSGQASPREAFLRQLWTSSRRHGDQAQKRLTTVSGDSGVAGVKEGVPVCFQRL